MGLGAPGESAFRDEPEPDDPGAPAPERSGGSDCPCNECDGKCGPADDDRGRDDDDPEDDDPEDDDPGDDDPGDDDSEDDDPEDDDPEDDDPDGDGPGRGPHGPSGGHPDLGAGADPASPRPPAAPPPSPPSPPPPPPPPPPAAQSPEPPVPSSTWSAPPSSPAPPKPTDLIIPQPPSSAPGPARRKPRLRPALPALSRALAALAAASPRTTACVTVTDDNGYAIGHGCLTTGRRRAPLPGAPDPPLTALPSRLNLTITATRLTKLLKSAGQPRPPDLRHRPAGPAPPAPSKARPPDPPGDPPWCGTWTITLPSGLQYAVPIEPVPTHACDHRRESQPNEPNDMLRHLVQIRDAECTFPTCSRHAKESDFEHATPYDQGGQTCACNAGARSRSSHQGTQLPGWQSHPAQTRMAPMANPQRPDLHPRTQARPHLTSGTMGQGSEGLGSG